MPDYRGLFLRGYGSCVSNHYGEVTHRSGEFGIIQGDSIRNITGISGFTDESGRRTMYGSTYYSGSIRGLQDGGSSGNVIHIDASKEVPTDVENRPINIAVKYFIRTIG